MSDDTQHSNAVSTVKTEPKSKIGISPKILVVLGSAALVMAFYAGSLINAPTEIPPEQKPADTSEESKLAPVQEQKQITQAEIRAEFEKAAKDARAYFEAGKYEEAFQLASRAAEYGIADSRYLMFQLHGNPANLSMKQDTSALVYEQLQQAKRFNEALPKLRRLNPMMGMSFLFDAAAQGHIEANAELGHQYANGSNDLPKNLDKAVQHSNFAAAQENARAQYNLGTFYASGLGVQENQNTAYSWYKKAADNGYGIAARVVGMAYDDGYILPKNPSQAMHYFSIAANQGDPKGQHSLGRYYLLGLASPVDYARAADWTAKAARQNYPGSYSNLGYMKAKGLGMIKDIPKSVQLYFMAAQLGDGQGAYNYADAMFAYMGPPAVKKYDLEKWLEFAIEKDIPRARAKLRAIRTETRLVQGFQRWGKDVVDAFLTADKASLDAQARKVEDILGVILKAGEQK